MMRTTPRGLGLLLPIHLALLFAAAAVLAHGQYPVVGEILFDAEFYAAAGLVGLWAGLDRRSKIAGFTGIALGLLALAGAVALARWHDVSGVQGPGYDVFVVLWICLLQLALAAVAMASTVAVTLWLRDRGVRLASVEPGVAATGSDTLRFSLWQLLLAVTAVAVLCLGSVVILAFWAALGQGRPLARSPLVVGLAAVIGLLPPYYFPTFSTDIFPASSPAAVASSAATFALQAVLVVGSLCLVRLRGYRLVRMVTLG